MIQANNHGLWNDDEEDDDLVTVPKSIVLEASRNKIALIFAKDELKKHHDNLALEFIRRIETGEAEGG